jgi:hypothetical protein
MVSELSELREKIPGNISKIIDEISTEYNKVSQKVLPSVTSILDYASKLAKMFHSKLTGFAEEAKLLGKEINSSTHYIVRAINFQFCVDAEYM